MSGQKTSRYSLVIRYMLIVGLTFGIIFLLFRMIDRHVFLDTIRNINIKFVLVALLFTMAARPTIGAMRWQTLLRVYGCNVSLRESIYIIWACYPLELVLPLKMGRLVRLAYLKKIGRASFITGGVTELTNIVLSFVGLGILVLLGSLYWLFHVKAAGSSLLTILLPVESYFKKTMLKIKNVFWEIRHINKRTITFLLAYALSTNILHVATFCVVAKAVGVIIPFYKAIVFIPIIMLIANLPITIAGLGTREACILFFFGNVASNESLLAIGLVFSFVWFIFPSVTGSLFSVPFYKTLLK